MVTVVTQRTLLASPQVARERTQATAEDAASRAAEREARVRSMMQAGASASVTAQSLEARVGELLAEAAEAADEIATLQSQCTRSAQGAPRS